MGNIHSTYYMGHIQAHIQLHSTYYTDTHPTHYIGDTSNLLNRSHTQLAILVTHIQLSRRVTYRQIFKLLHGSHTQLTTGITYTHPTYYTSHRSKVYIVNSPLDHKHYYNAHCVFKAQNLDHFPHI